MKAIAVMNDGDESGEVDFMNQAVEETAVPPAAQNPCSLLPLFHDIETIETID